MKYRLQQKSKLNTDVEAIDKLQKQLKLSKLTASLLCARGITEIGAAEAFLNPSLEQLYDPFLFRDMQDAVSAIKHTISTKGRICIYGDYDADGVSASAILYRTLSKMGALVEVFLPNRMEHGYGLSMENIERLKGIALLITVDCGITNVAEIAKAKEMGITTILTDHHECPHILPKADYILNPKCPGEEYPFDSLCGAGVAFKLSQALIGEQALEWLDIAALATIADIVPLLEENRVIAALGLKTLNKNPNLGIEALVQKACAKRTTDIDAQTVSFVLAPRINAAGRISTAQVAFKLLTEENEQKLETLAEQLCSLNIDRQQKQEKMIAEAMQMQEQKGVLDDKLILFYQKDWDIGIVGLAASKVSERYTRPAILLGESAPGIYTGSARSIAGINIYDALAPQRELFEKFGGHAGAAGLTIKEEHLPKLKHRVNEYLKEHCTEEMFQPIKAYDLTIEPSNVSASLIAEFEKLRPFGCKNEPIELLIKGAQIAEVKAIGEDKHAKFRIVKQGKDLNGIVFGTKAIDIPAYADIVGILNLNTFDMKPQMIVSTLSYEETVAQKMRYAKEHLDSSATLSEKEQALYLIGREKLLEVYVVLKGIHDQNISFVEEKAFFSFLQKYIKDIGFEQIVFALLVFEEIGLLEIKKNDRIHIVIRAGKHELSESSTYQKFFSGEN